ncbi:MAG TPA: ZIP family metal transporter [Candidatus Paceibacterota bacterium]|nr:ZIP family metal transporter [Candidatus Paceibacterota bacterium]
MMTITIYTLASVAIVSIVSLAGVVTLSWNDRFLKASVFVLVSLAVGALLGDAFLHLIPEAFEEASNPTALSLAIIGGLLLFFVLEKFLHWHHHHGLEASEPEVHPVGKMILISDGVHNFIDGLIIAASFLVSTEIGIATTIAVILHEIPQEIGDFGVLIHSGYSKAKALWLNFFSAIVAFAGAGVGLLLGSATESFAMLLIPIAAGGFIYIAMTDLIPELHKTKLVRHSVIQLIAILVGVAAMAGLLALEGEEHTPSVESAPIEGPQ